VGGTNKGCVKIYDLNGNKILASALAIPDVYALDVTGSSTHHKKAKVGTTLGADLAGGVAQPASTTVATNQATRIALTSGTSVLTMEFNK